MAWILLGAAVVLLVLWVAYRMAFYSPVGEQNDPYRILPNGDYQARREEMLRLIAALEARPCERVSVTSHDGLRLTGRYYHHADGAPLDIAFHGYRGHALRDFCGGSCISFQLGHNLLLVDQRAHGESEGHTITFGANARFGSPDIALFGVSMGAATVLLATALDLPENVRCAVADSPYSRAEDIIGTVGRDMGLPGAPVILLARCAARVFGGFRLGDASPLDAVRRAKVPVLLFHGEADRLVPCAMSGVLQENCASAVRRYTYPNAGHGLSYLVDREGYTAAVVDFLAQCGERESS